MKAICMAAGYGTRLGSLTKTIPKPMIKVKDKPVIAHTIEKLNKAGIDQVIINLHYLYEQIIEYFDDGVLYFYEPVLLGHEGTIKALRPWLSHENFFVINGDTLSEVDFQEMMSVHKKGTITVLMDEWRSAGVWLYDKEYFNNKDLPVIPYRPKNLVWFDIGVPSRLEEAKRYYEHEATYHMP